MRYFIIFISFLFTSLFTFAQNDLTRGRVQNTTDPEHNNVHYPASYKTAHRRVGSQATAPMNSMGSPKIPVVLVQFGDKKFSLPGTTSESQLTASVSKEDSMAIVKSFYDKFFNGRNYNGHLSYGSVYDYYVFQSDGKFTPEFEIIGPVTLDYGYAVYGKGASDYNISQFYREACEKAISNFSVEWSKFDNNNNGTVDLVFFIYAGLGANGGGDVDTIWPKESTENLTVKTNNQSIVFSSYGCACEIFNKKVDGIGLSTHELGHALGLPDFYDKSSNMAFGMDYWDIMDSGCYQCTGHQPCIMSAYERDFMGWRSLDEVQTDEETTILLTPVEEQGTGVIVRNPDYHNEYYILENRQNKYWDTNLGWVMKDFRDEVGYNHGLLITHVNYVSNKWGANSLNYGNSPQCMSVIPSGGKLTTSSLGYETPWAESIYHTLFPGPDNVTELPYDAPAITMTNGKNVKVSLPLSYNNSTTLQGESIPSIGYSFLNIEETGDGNISVTIRRAGYEPKYVPGDIDRDGSLTINDITTLIDAYLNSGTDSIYDVDGDGSVTISDITALIDLYLNAASQE